MEEIGRLAQRFEAFTGYVAPRCYRHPLVTLLVAGAVVAGSTYLARDLRVDTDLVGLLPETFPSVESLGVLRERIGVVGNVTIIARGDDPKQLEAYAADVAKELEALDTISFVTYRRSDRFFEKRALYFLEVEDIEEIQDRIDETIRWHKKDANPLLVDIADEGKPSLDFSHLEKKRSPLKKTLGTVGKPKTPFYTSNDGKLIVVFARPTERASDFSFTKRVMADVDRVVGGIDTSKYGLDSVEIGGRYKKRQEQQSTIEGDLGTTSAIALLLLVGYIVFHFRRLSAVILLIVPLLAGLVVLLGVASSLFGTLNILTAFVGAILLGLGIDHGIHLLGRFQHERARGQSAPVAVERTFRGTGRGVALAGLTTAVGFSGLAVSEFRAFHEFGVIAGVGVLLVVISYLTVLPALLYLFGGAMKGVDTKDDEFLVVTGVWRFRRPVFWATTIAAVGLGLVGRSVDFDYDFRRLEGGDIPAYKLDKVVDDILGRTQTPIIVFVDSVAEEKTVAAELRRRAEDSENSGVHFVIASGDVVPSDQDDKREAIDELVDILDKVPVDALDAKDRERFDKLVGMTKADPFRFEDLPEDLRRSFSGTGVVLVFPSISLSDGLAVLALSESLRGLPLPDGRTVNAAGEAMVVADVLRMVIRESPVVISLTLVLVFLAMWLLLGRIRLAVFCMLPALLTVFCTFGLAALLDVKLNYLNIVMLPVLFGMAVDAGVHLVTRGVLSGADPRPALAETGRAVWGASLTTGMGFGALMIAHHPGLNSFGALALIGLSLIVVSSLGWLTALIGLLTDRRTKQSATT